MKSILTTVCLAFVAAAGVACGSGPAGTPCTIAKTDLSGVRITYVEASGIGRIAVRLTAPSVPL